MRKGIKVFIVAIVALGTNFGLHAAFGWGGSHHWRGHHGNYRHDDDYNRHENFDEHANPWNCSHRENSNAPKDTLK